MRVLILSCNTGNGHNSVAMAIKEKLEEQGHSCDIKDALAFVSPVASFAVSKVHNLFYKYAPNLYAKNYDKSMQNKESIEKTTARCLNFGVKKLYRHCLDNHYDMVISTHVFGAYLSSQIVLRYNLCVKTGIVYTDYGFGLLSFINGLDYYIIPDESMREELVSAGVDDDKIMVRDMPLKQSFLASVDKVEAKKQIGIDSNKKHLLIVGNSLGHHRVLNLLEKLQEYSQNDIEISVLCGKERNLFKELRRKFNGIENIHIWDITNKMSLFMDSADLMLTKPGGITISEAMSKNLSMVLVNVVGGPEKFNFDLFVEKGWAIPSGKSTDEMATTCLEAMAVNGDNLL